MNGHPCYVKECRRPALTYAMGVWRCRDHEPVPAPNCSHSLVAGDRCAYCGAVVPA